jgi:hypothetical protein
LERGLGVNSMVVVLLIAGAGSLLVGLLAIGFGIPVKEFSFGNTLILTGSVFACTGMVLLGLWIAVRELKTIAQRLGPGIPATATPRQVTAPRDSAPENEGFPFGRDEPALENPGQADPAVSSSATSPAPWQDEAAARDRVRVDAPVPEPIEAAPAVKPKRNLLFSSSSKKERERAQARATDPSAIADIEVRPAQAAAPPVPEANEVSPPATFDDAWPQPERAKTAAPPPRGSRAPSTFTEPNPGAAKPPDRRPPVPRNEEQPPVTVLKSGVVDGMAYSLYSDGSIEAQMPEGMMRFASIDELRSHLDQRP